MADPESTMEDVQMSEETMEIFPDIFESNLDQERKNNDEHEPEIDGEIGEKNIEQEKPEEKEDPLRQSMEEKRGFTAENSKVEIDTTLSTEQMRENILNSGMSLEQQKEELERLENILANPEEVYMFPDYIIKEDADIKITSIAAMKVDGEGNVRSLIVFVEEIKQKPEEKPENKIEEQQVEEVLANLNIDLDKKEDVEKEATIGESLSSELVVSREQDAERSEAIGQDLESDVVQPEISNVGVVQTSQVDLGSTTIQQVGAENLGQVDSEHSAQGVAQVEVSGVQAMAETNQDVSGKTVVEIGESVGEEAVGVVDEVQSRPEAVVAPSVVQQAGALDNIVSREGFASIDHSLVGEPLVVENIAAEQIDLGKDIVVDANKAEDGVNKIDVPKDVDVRSVEIGKVNRVITLEERVMELLRDEDELEKMETSGFESLKDESTAVVKEMDSRAEVVVAPSVVQALGQAGDQRSVQDTTGVVREATAIVNEAKSVSLLETQVLDIRTGKEVSEASKVAVIAKGAESLQVPDIKIQNKKEIKDNVVIPFKIPENKLNTIKEAGQLPNINEGKVTAKNQEEKTSKNNREAIVLSINGNTINNATRNETWVSLEKPREEKRTKEESLKAKPLDGHEILMQILGMSRNGTEFRATEPASTKSVPNISQEEPEEKSVSSMPSIYQRSSNGITLKIAA